MGETPRTGQQSVTAASSHLFLFLLPPARCCSNSLTWIHQLSAVKCWYDLKDLALFSLLSSDFYKPLVLWHHHSIGLFLRTLAEWSPASLFGKLCSCNEVGFLSLGAQSLMYWSSHGMISVGLPFCTSAITDPGSSKCFEASLHCRFSHDLTSWFRITLLNSLLRRCMPTISLLYCKHSSGRIVKNSCIALYLFWSATSTWVWTKGRDVIQVKETWPFLHKT